MTNIANSSEIIKGNGPTAVSISEIVAVTETITLTNPDLTKPRIFVSFEYFSDQAGTTPVTPSAGTETITIKMTQHSIPEAVTNNVFDVTAPGTVNFAASVYSIEAVPAGITGASFRRVVLVQNEV